MNFENVELTAFIKFISKVTGRNIVFGDKIEGTVSVVSPTAVDSEQAYAMFQSVLATQGLTTVDEGAVLRIVPIKEARLLAERIVDAIRSANLLQSSRKKNLRAIEEKALWPVTVARIEGIYAELPKG